MPERKTLARARRDRAQGKSASTQAGEFVKETFEHAKSGKTPVKSRKQAVAIGLSKARRAGVKVGPNPNARKKKGAGGRTAGSRTSAGRKAPARKSGRKTARRPSTRSSRSSAARRRKT